MKKIITGGFKFIGYLVISLILGLFYSIKYLITGKSILGRLAIISVYAGIVASFIYKPMIFKVIMIIILLLVAILSISLMYKSGNATNDGNDSNNTNYDNAYSSYKPYKNPFFDGMNFEEAKKEYRKLMKKYHPDNIDGSLEMTQKVAEAYSNYCSACGR